MEFKFKFGDELKEAVTGFKGTVMGITWYATKCVHYGLLPKKLNKDGTTKDWNWFDESRLSKTGKFTDVTGDSTSAPAGHNCPNAPEFSI